MKRTKSIWNSLPFVLTLFLLIGITLQKYYAAPVLFFGEYHTAYNNYLIFKFSGQHLIQGLPLYDFYPSEYGDLFKYSPTFAWLMIPFSALPDWLGLFLWNALNCLPLVWILYVLSEKNARLFLPVFFIMAVELATSLHNAQSNGLLSFLLLAYYASLMKGNYLLSGLLLALSVYLKLFGGIAILLVFLFPQTRSHLLSFAGYFVLLGILPLIHIGPNALIYHYVDWYELLKSDGSHALNYSLSTLINRYNPAQWNIPDLWVSIAGLLILIGVLAAVRKRNNAQQMAYFLMAFLMMWFVMFNHKSESPTYIIAMSGVALLWIPLQKNTIFRICMGIALVFVSLGSTDLFPLHIRESFFQANKLKAMGLLPIFVYTWFYILTHSSPSSKSD